MGRPRKVESPVFTVTAAPPGTDGEDVKPTEQAADTLAQLEDEGRRRAEARIFRLDPVNRKMALLDTVDASLADESYIRQNYGGGEYSIQFWGPKADGTWGYLKKECKTFVIDSSVPFRGSPRDRVAIGAVKTEGAPAAGSSLIDMGMLQLFTTMQENSRSQAAMQKDHSLAMMTLMQQMGAPRENGIEKILAVMAPILAPLIAGMVNKKDPVEIATTLMASMRPENNKSALSSLHEALEIKDMLGAFGAAPENEEAGWMRLLEKVVPGAIEILKNESMKTGKPLTEIAHRPAVARIAAPSTATSPVSTSPLPASASSVAAPLTSPETAPVADEWTALEPYVAQLVHFAAINKPPFGVMNMILTLAPDAMIGGIRELTARDDAPEFLMTRFPQLRAYADWTTELLEDFWEHFHPEADEEPPEPLPAEGESPDGVTS